MAAEKENKFKESTLESLSRTIEELEEKILSKSNQNFSDNVDINAEFRERFGHDTLNAHNIILDKSSHGEFDSNLTMLASLPNFIDRATNSENRKQLALFYRDSIKTFIRKVVPERSTVYTNLMNEIEHVSDDVIEEPTSRDILRTSVEQVAAYLLSSKNLQRKLNEIEDENTFHNSSSKIKTASDEKELTILLGALRAELRKDMKTTLHKDAENPIMSVLKEKNQKNSHFAKMKSFISYENLFAFTGLGFLASAVVSTVFKLQNIQITGFSFVLAAAGGVLFAWSLLIYSHNSRLLSKISEEKAKLNKLKKSHENSDSEDN